jgi:hypothetical protein
MGFKVLISTSVTMSDKLNLANHARNCSALTGATAIYLMSVPNSKSRLHLYSWNLTTLHRWNRCQVLELRHQHVLSAVTQRKVK